MKKLIFSIVMILFIGLGASNINANEPIDSTDETAVQVNEPVNDAATEVSFGEEVLTPPEMTMEDLKNTPKGDDPLEKKVKYIVGALGFLFYNFGASKIKSKKSWTIAAMLYRFGNWLVKDEALNGGSHNIEKSS